MAQPLGNPLWQLPLMTPLDSSPCTWVPLTYLEWIRCKVPTLIVPTVIVPTLKVPMLEVPTVQSSYDSQFLLIQCSYSCKVPTVQSSYGCKVPTVAKVPTGSKFIQFQCFYWFRVPTFRSSYRCKVSTGKISWNKIFLRFKVLAVAKLLIVPSCLLCIIFLFLG